MKDLLKQALDALERVAAHLVRPQDVEAMQALRAAIAQPESEPVAWMNESGTLAWSQKDINGFCDETRVRYPVPLYTHPAQPYVPLSDKTIGEIELETDHKSMLGGWNMYFARAIERAVRGEKT